MEALLASMGFFLAGLLEGVSITTRISLLFVVRRRPTRTMRYGPGGRIRAMQNRQLGSSCGRRAVEMWPAAEAGHAGQGDFRRTGGDAR